MDKIFLWPLLSLHWTSTLTTKCAVKLCCKLLRQHSRFQLTVAYSLDHVKDIQLLVVEIIVPFYFKPTNCIHLNDKLDNGTYFIRVLVDMHLWSTSTLTWWLKLAILLDSEVQSSKKQIFGSLSLEKCLQYIQEVIVGHHLYHLLPLQGDRNYPEGHW